MKNSIKSGTKTITYLLIFSLLVNVCFMYVVIIQSRMNIGDDKEDNFINVVYDLGNYKSTSYENQTLKQRMDRMYDEYLKDKKATKESYYNNGEVDAYWKKKCVNSVRRIMVLGTKIEMIEKMLNITSTNDKKKQDIDMMIENKGYHEKLLDMSNFYAGFLNNETYQVIQTTLD